MPALLELFGYEPSAPDAEWVYQDILAPGVAEAAVKDMDACVYVALVMPGRGAPLPQYAVNVVAPFNLAEACARAKLRKLVYASTCSVNLGAEGQPAVSELDPPNPWTDYALSKWLAEEMLRLHSQQRGPNALCLRLGTVRPHVRVAATDRYIQYYIDVRDVARAFRLGVEDARIQFDVLHVVSQGEPVCNSPVRAREVLGFDAQYNGPGHFAELRRRELEFQRKHPEAAPRHP